MAVVAGAGPVGALAALLLARRGVKVVLVERKGALATESHASTFHPSTLDLLAGVGIGLAADPAAVRVDSIQWRDERGAVRAEVAYRLLEGRTGHPFRLHLDQQALLDRLAVMLAADPRVEFRPGCTVVGLDPARTAVTVSGEDGGLETIAAAAVVGCDGARSTVRELAGIGFPVAGYPTGAVRAFVAGDPGSQLPRESGNPPLAGLCYFRGNGDGMSLLRMADDTRLVVRTTGEQEDAARLREALAAATPWSFDDLEVRRIDSYRLERGVAESFLAAEGEVLVLGDAAHVTSTAGGLNMNSGIHDAFSLMPLLADFLFGRCGRHEVEAAADTRRRFMVEEVVPRTERRVRGLQDDDAGRPGEHMEEIAGLAEDPGAARKFLVEASLLDSPLDPAGTTVGAR